MRTLRRILAVLLLVLCAAPAARAAEEILAYDVAIDLDSADAFTVTEQIRVRAEGDQIRRGIYRDFPLTFVDADGRTRRVGFEVLSVRRDGVDEPWHEERGGGGTRIYVGASDVFLAPGIHTYSLVYRTSRQIRRFADYDELYWNVTGNDWVFPIRSVTATVRLPDGVRAIRPNGYTGAFGDDKRDYTLAERDGGSTVVFATTRTLRAGEGLTISVSLPKGVIPEPEGAEAIWLDWRNQIVGGIGLGVVLIYYGATWWTVGRDPPGGTIIPRFSAPDGVSPSLANYVYRRGLSENGWTALSAACVDLAVKGVLTFEDLDGDVRIKPTGTAAPPGLPAGERAVARWFDGQSRPLTLTRADGPRVASLGSSFRTAIVAENRGRYFATNRLWNVLGIVLSVLAIVAVIGYGEFTGEEVAFLAPLLVLSIWVSVLSVKFGRMLTAGRRWWTRAGGIIGLAVIGLLVLGALAEAFAVYVAEAIDPTFPSIVAALVATNVLFFLLMGAPTVLGRSVLDDIEGLRLYLSVAEADRMNMARAPEVTPSRYEALLPYAIALGVEKPWSQALQAWLATSAAAAAGAAATYQPTWYHGAFDRSVSDRMSSTLGSMSQAFSSSVPPPKSTSSGSSGGGFSGGGGGGGGGGGW